MKKLSDLNMLEISGKLEIISMSNYTESKQDVSPSKSIIKDIFEGLNKVSAIPDKIILEIENNTGIYLKQHEHDTSVIHVFNLYGKDHLTDNTVFNDLKYQLFFSRLYTEMKKVNPVIAEKLYFRYAPQKKDELVFKF